MPAYVIAEVEITNPEQYKAYMLKSKPSVEAMGGRYLARGGQTDVLEGAWQPKRMVILEFPTAAQARAWYDGPEYTAIRELRKGAGNANIITVEGL